MRHARAAFCLVTLLVMSTLPLVSASEGRATVCDSPSSGTVPNQITIPDQECYQIALGQLEPGTIVEFDVTGDVNFDFLVFRNAALQVYANDQSYRSTAYWAEDTVFEDMVGSGRWHWTVPADESQQNWYVVLDNLAHPGDDGEGAQGGSALQVSFDSQNIVPSYWTIHDSLVNLGVNSHTKLVDENDLILDEGTQVAISAIPMSGNPDLFILTENQRLSYLDGNSPEFRITGADLLQVTTDSSVVWTVDSTYANQPLYLYADNEDGPTGGGDGQTTASFTVIITLLPLLDATITDDSSAVVDVGEMVTVSANSTPNLSNQVDTAAYEWDLDDDGTFELTQSWAEVSWSTEGIFDVNLRINGVDGRTDTSTISIAVLDTTMPTPIINGGNNLVRGFDESFTLTSSSQDNYGIGYEEWYADGLLIQNDTGTGNSFTYSFSSAGNHSVDLIVYDSANWPASLSISVYVQDRTAPELDPIIGPTDVMAGEENTWRLNATDSDTPNSLSWSWDFDRSIDIDSDGDTKNDAEASGDLVKWTFTEGGDYYITCTVTNEQGLTSTRELIVHVEAQPTSPSALLDSMVFILPIGAIIGAIVGGIFFVRWMNQKRSHQELMEEEALRLAAEEAEAAREPDHEEQLTMFQNRGGGVSSGFQRGGGDEMAEIAGVGTGYGAQQTPTRTQVSHSDDAALLSAFAEPDVEPTPVSEPEPKPEPEPEPEPQPAATSAPSGSVLSSGIEMPNVLNESKQTAPITTTPTPQPEPSVVETTPTTEQTTEVVGTCGDCGQKYAVDMPQGVEQAQIDCPKCGNRSTIRR